jgi:hypothetical protein
MTNQILDNLEKDLELLKTDKFHPKHDDLKNIVFGEDIPELIKFVKKVNATFDGDFNQNGTGEQYRGAKHMYEVLKREIYGT